MSGNNELDSLLGKYRSMYLIRRTEEMIGEMVTSGEVVCPAHLYIGQEATAVGVCSHLNKDDYIFSTHRSHGHYLAKGGSLKALFAEILGRSGGCSGGRGGSMHLVQPEDGIMGSSSIVGGCLPIGVGAAMSAAMKNDGKISTIFFGDGAMDEGVFFEVLNFAALKKLPVFFVCENNYYATHMQICRRLPCDKETKNVVECNCGLLSKRVDPFCIPTKIVDGYDVNAVSKAAAEAVNYVRSNGPFFLESITYRWRGHVGPNWDVDLGLRAQDEIDHWMDKCAIESLGQSLMTKHGVKESELKGVEESVLDQLEDALSFARKSPLPQPDSIQNNLFRS